MALGCIVLGVEVTIERGGDEKLCKDDFDTVGLTDESFGTETGRELSLYKIGVRLIGDII